MLNQTNSIDGFTLTELLIVMAIAGVVLSIGIPSFNDAILSNRLSTLTNEFITTLNVARSEAIRRGQPVVIRKTGNEWEEGWYVFVDVIRNTAATKNVFDDNDDGIPCEPTEDCIIRTSEALPNYYTFRENNFPNFISYRADGTSNQAGSYVLCDNHEGDYHVLPHKSVLIIINRVGRMRLGTDDNHNGIPEEEDGSEIGKCNGDFQ